MCQGHFNGHGSLGCRGWDCSLDRTNSWADLAVCEAPESSEMKLRLLSYDFPGIINLLAENTTSFANIAGALCCLHKQFALHSGFILFHFDLPKISRQAAEWQLSGMSVHVNKLLLTQCESSLPVRQIMTAGKISKGKKETKTCSISGE